jgi:predicted enzyme related to lactoylglutathione lyase
MRTRTNALGGARAEPVGDPVVHFEINTAHSPELARVYADAFDWELQADGEDYTQIRTSGVCAGTGAPGIDGGIGPSDPGDDFVTFYVQVPDVAVALDRASRSAPRWTCRPQRPDAS